MIHSLSGVLTDLESDFFVVNCSGIGFKCKSDAKTIFELKNSLNSNIKVFTILNIRENSWDLFGFNDLSHIECFKMLTNVTGVGPKAALSIFSEFSPDEILYIVNSGDHSNLTRASGVGDKMARRIILELKGKLKNVDVKNININKSNAMKALEVLGYSNREVIPILEKLDSSLSVESLIQQTLKIMGG